MFNDLLFQFLKVGKPPNENDFKFPDKFRIT